MTRQIVEVKVGDVPVRLEAWPEYGAWYEVGQTDPITGGKVGSLYAPMFTDGTPPQPDEVAEIENAFEEVADERSIAEAHRAACITADTHRLPGEADSPFCVTCDTGDCGDCSRPVFYSDEAEDYRHIERDAPACFLIQS